MKKALALLVILLVAAPAPFQAASPQAHPIRVVGSASILAPAVTRVPGGYLGVLINVSLVVIEGHGDVYVSTSPLTEVDMQGAARAAVEAACRLLRVNPSKYDFLFKVRSNAAIVGGPSAGLEMAILTISALTGLPINRSVMATGMIVPDGSVGPVGGILQKINASRKVGVKLFLVPLGQTVVTTYVQKSRKVGPFVFYYVEPIRVDVADYAWKHWGIRVREVVSLEEAVKYFLGLRVNETLRPPTPTPALEETCEYIARALLDRANESLLTAKTELSKATLNPLVRAYIRRLIADARRRLSSAYARNGASAWLYAVKAGAYAEWVRLMVMYAGGSGLSDYVSQLKGDISRLARGGNASLMCTLYAAAAEEALARAQRLWQTSIDDSLKALAEAKYLALAAELWSKSELGVPLGRVSPEVASLYLEEAGHAWSYSSIVLQESGAATDLTSDAQLALELAKEAMAQGWNALALAHAVRALALSEVALDVLTLQVAGARSEALISYARNSSLREIAMVCSGSAPQLSLVAYGDSAASNVEKLLAYRLAFYTASVQAALQRRAGQPAEKHNAEKLPSGASRPGMPIPNIVKKAGYGNWGRLAAVAAAVIVTIAVAAALSALAASRHARSRAAGTDLRGGGLRGPLRTS